MMQNETMKYTVKNCSLLFGTILIKYIIKELVTNGPCIASALV